MEEIKNKSTSLGNEIITLYTLNIYNRICQLLNKVKATSLKLLISNKYIIRKMRWKKFADYTLLVGFKWHREYSSTNSTFRVRNTVTEVVEYLRT